MFSTCVNNMRRWCVKNAPTLYNYDRVFFVSFLYTVIEKSKTVTTVYKYFSIYMVI